jgi:hypothetical protein
MLNKWAFVIAVPAIVAVLSVAIILPLQESTQSLGPHIPAWLTSPTTEISATQLADAYSAHGITLELPSQLPSGLRLTSIHVPNANSPFGYAMLTYNAKGITNFQILRIRY